MPLHDFQCGCGEVTEALVQADTDFIQCPACLAPARKVYLKFPYAYVSMDIHYRSPIDDRPITSSAARQEDLARNGCRPYETGERDEAVRRRLAEDARFESSIDETVEAEISRMPVRKKELLEQELRAGADTTVVRSSPN